jgi:hypothetical protein
MIIKWSSKSDIVYVFHAQLRESWADPLRALAALSVGSCSYVPFFRRLVRSSTTACILGLVARRTMLINLDFGLIFGV